MAKTLLPWKQEADSPEELENYLQGLQEALTLPILKMEDLPPIPQQPSIVQRGTPIEALWEELGLEKDELAIVRG